MLSYKSDIGRLYMTRRKKMATAMWTVYYFPYVEDIYKYRIPEIWMKTPQRYMKCMKDGMGWWINLGVRLGLMTCYMAFTDPIERTEKCRIRDWSKGGRLPDDKDEPEPEPEPDPETRESYESDPDVIEGASLVSALGSIVTFLRNIEFIGVAIGRFGKKFPGDPLGAIIGILGLILGTIFGLLLMIIYLLLTLLGVFWIILGIWGVIATFVTAILYTLYQILMSIILFIPYFVLWLIDLPTGGLVSKLLRCENLPDDWSRLPNFVENNKYERGAFFPFCWGTCRGRYTPVGCLCKKRPHHMPDYCPQQQIFRTFRGMAVKEPYAFDKYRPVAGFAKRTLAKKQQIIIKAYQQKMGWYQKCFSQLHDFDYINKHVCNNVHLIPLLGVQSKRLRVLCKECYCDYKATDYKLGISAKMTNDDERTTSMCVRLVKAKKKAELTDNGMGGPATELLKRTLLISMLVIAVLVMFYSMLQAAKKMVESVG
jgi:hypothetical protein